MLERPRLLSWRYRRRAAILYLALLLTVFLAVGWYLHRLLRKTMWLLEVKFNEVIPRWLCTCLNRFDLQIQRLSKYCQGIERCGMEQRTLQI